MTKKCTKCGSEGPFRYQKTTKDGLTSWCRDCLNKASRECRLRRLEHYRAVNRRWYPRTYPPAEQPLNRMFNKWPIQDEDVLVKHFGMGTMSREELVAYFGRSWCAINAHARAVLDLRANGNDWRQDEGFEIDGEEAA